MRLPQDLDTVEPIPFAGGTGLEIWCTVSVAHEGDVDALRGILDVNPDLVHCGHYGCEGLGRDCYRPLHFAVHANRLRATFSLAHEISVGQRIDFIVDSDGDNRCDWTRFKGSIAVREP